MTEAATFFTVEKKTVLGTYYLHVEFDSTEALKNWVDWLDGEDSPFSVDPEQVPFEPAKPPARQAPRPQNRAQGPQRAVNGVKCGICGGPTWDNRETKTGRQPDYKCKDKDNCGGAAWYNDGELTWKQ